VLKSWELSNSNKPFRLAGKFGSIFRQGYVNKQPRPTSFTLQNKNILIEKQNQIF